MRKVTLSIGRLLDWGFEQNSSLSQKGWPFWRLGPATLLIFFCFVAVFMALPLLLLEFFTVQFNWTPSLHDKIFGFYFLPFFSCIVIAFVWIAVAGMKDGVKRHTAIRRYKKKIKEQGHR